MSRSASPIDIDPEHPRGGDDYARSDDRSRHGSPDRERPYDDDRDTRGPPPIEGRDEPTGGRSGGRNGRSNRRANRPPRTYEPNPVPSRILGVFGLSLFTKEADLEKEFGRFGKIESVTIVIDSKLNRSRGFGFITMADIEDAKRAMAELNGMVLHDRSIRVDFSKTERPHDPTPGVYRGERSDRDRRGDRRDRLPPRGSGPRYRDDYDRRPPPRDYDRRGPPPRDSYYDRPPRSDRDPYDARDRYAPYSRRSPPLGRRSPVYGRRSPPPRRDRSPYGRDRSPIGRDRSPYGRDRSPIGRDRSPYGRDRSPIGRDRSPYGRDRSPIGRDRSPIPRRDRSPAPLY